MTLESLVAEYGYFALLIGTFLEGETILVVAGVFAQMGFLELPWVIVVAFIGTFTGDQTFYYLGRIKGIQFLEKRPRWKRKTDKVFVHLHKHKILLILGFRFLYGIRAVTPFAIGASGVKPSLFFPLNAIGAAIWAVSVGILGFYFGKTIELFIEDVKQYEMSVLGGLVAIGLLVWWYRRARKTSKEKATTPTKP